LLRALTFWCGERHAARLATGGLLIDPTEALRVGLIDEIAPVGDVVARTLSWAQELTSRPPTALRLTRALVRRPLIEAFASVEPTMLEGVVEQWFAAETQTVLRALAARLGKPRA
jgi:3,2-trans-enoyl-CoA isomerase